MRKSKKWKQRINRGSFAKDNVYALKKMQSNRIFFFTFTRKMNIVFYGWYFEQKTVPIISVSYYIHHPLYPIKSKETWKMLLYQEWRSER